ncbi:hypothetical protein FVR03_16795 [Pontibacter qinzhouensis]|uniref:Uncharacterized protein n=1 Tax=Pontibacter qinzhouensis TaxID=2603253 RepID=A0A5C8JEL0_9BACT|nr:hypothetical protein [Pontibacter qinzhouensis]TXK36800.1 hypothetical protein FVR03_16795 [Pontibacter qinzhouensis]
MNTQEYFAIVQLYRPNLKKLLINIIRTKLNIVAPATEQIEDTLNEVILTTAEKVHAGKVRFNNRDEVEMYLTRSSWFDFKNKSKKRSQSMKVNKPFNDEIYRQLADEPEEDPIINNTNEVYRRIFDYVFSKYEMEEAAIYKAYTIDGYTFDQLAETTQYKRYKCYDICKKIRADVRANKDLLLATEK